MTILAHDVQAKQAERDRLAADVAAWVARNGQPPCYGPEVSAAAMAVDSHIVSRMKEVSNAARRRAKK